MDNLKITQAPDGFRLALLLAVHADSPKKSQLAIDLAIQLGALVDVKQQEIIKNEIENMPLEQIAKEIVKLTKIMSIGNLLYEYTPGEA